MIVSIRSSIPGRLRLASPCGIQLSESEARGLAYRLLDEPGVTHALVHEANGSILVCYDVTCTSEQHIKTLCEGFSYASLPQASEVRPGKREAALEVARENNRFVMALARMGMRRTIQNVFFPVSLRTALGCYFAARIIWTGIKHLLKGELVVEVLDACALSAALLRGSYSEASTIAFLLGLSAMLEEHVASRARLALRNGIVVQPEKLLVRCNGEEREIAAADLEVGMLLHVGAGSVIPVDGCVVEGLGEVDESALTGESRPVTKVEGARVFAGTVLPEGDLWIEATTLLGSSRIDEIARMVEDNAQMKAGIQGKAERLADAIVPYSFLGFAGVWLLTRSIVKALGVLMVDFSCALKLSTPIALMSALDEARHRGMLVRGSKFLEALAEVDTVVFDKTGTLTTATPCVEKVISFGSLSESELLALAACIEEHFPHSVARAIVARASECHAEHTRELHAEVHYIVAHGIATSCDGHKVCIGSAHFIFEDEGVQLSDEQKDLLDKEAERFSVIYIARDTQLEGALCISDPVRSDAEGLVRRLRSQGIDQMIMLTGDTASCAAHIADELQLDGYIAQVLPEDKVRHIQDLQAQGHKVLMVGDGINDSPALAAADVSIALGDASDIARLVADVVIFDSELERIADLRELSVRLMDRIHGDFRTIVGVNSALIALGVGELLSLTQAAYIHNATTLALSMYNTTPLLKAEKTA